MDIDVVVKHTDPVRVAEITARVAGYGYDNINPVFEAHLAPLAHELLAQGLRLGICVAHYEEDGDEVVVHLGWEVGDQRVEERDGITVAELPVLEVAAAVHRGSMTEVMSVFEAMVRWIETNGYRLAGNGRKLYWQLHDDQSRQVTEMQLPVAPAAR